MDPGHFTELIESEEYYWWHLAKRELVTEILMNVFPAPGLTIEGGTGSARNLLKFSQRGYEVIGFDLIEDAVKNGRSRGQKVKWMTYGNSFSLPAAIANKGRNKFLNRANTSPLSFARVSRFTIACLKSCAQIERKLIHLTGIPFGLSRVGVLVK